MSLLSKETKKRLEGVKDLAQTVAEKNPIVHTLTTAKEVADSTYKIRYGKDPKYSRFLSKKQNIYSKYTSRPRSKYQTSPAMKKFEEDPIKRMIRLAKMNGDYKLANELRRLSR